MAALSNFLSHLYTMTILFICLILVDLVVLLRSFTENFSKSEKPPISAAKYLSLIEDRSPAVRFTDKLKPDSTECAVCLSDFEDGESVRRLNCRHTFHRDCLDRWLQQYWATCPLCRTRVLPDEVVAGYRLMQSQADYDGNDDEMIFLLSALHGNSLQRFF